MRARALYNLLFFLLLFGVGAAHAIPPECSEARFYAVYRINNTANSNTLEDFQVFFNLTREAHMPVDASSGLCFAVMNDYAPYWLEKNTSEWIAVWLNVPSIPASSELNVYVYYNVSTESSNASAVFIEHGLSLVSLWHFDEGSGAVAYDDVNNNDGTVNGPTWTTGKLGGALSFDGVDDIITAYDTNIPEETDALSVAFWMKANIEPFDRLIGHEGSVPDDGWYVGINNDDIAFRSRHNGEEYQNVDGKAALTNGTWYHVVVQKEAGDVAPNFYLNGSKLSRATTLGWYVSDSNGVVIGNRKELDRGFNGILDEIAIFNTTLTESQIANIYNNHLDHLTRTTVVRKYADPEPTTYKVEGEMSVLQIVTDYNISDWVLYIDISANKELSEMRIIAENPHNNNLTVNLSEHLIPATTYNYSYNTSVFNLGWGNFTVQYYDNASLLVHIDPLSITDEVPMTIILKDIATENVLPNTNFTYKAPDENGTVIEYPTSTDSSGQRTIKVKRFYDYTNIIITVVNLEGYYDKTYSTTVEPDKNITVYLEPIAGTTVQVIITVLDGSLYQPLQGVTVASNKGTKTTDSFGKVSFLGSSGETLTATLSKDGYETREITLEMYTRTETFYLTPLAITLQRSVSFSFSPPGSYLDENVTYVPRVTINNYDLLDNVSFIVAANREHLRYYQLTGEENPDKVEYYFYDLTDTAWCNATTLCTKTNTTITFRYTPKTLNDYGDTIIVSYTYSTGSDVLTDEKFYMFNVFRVGDISNMFSDSQKLWVGFGMVFFGTNLIVAFIERIGIQVSTRAAGVIAYFMVLVASYFRFFDVFVPILITLIFIGIQLGGKIL